MKLYNIMRKPPFFMRASWYISKKDHPIKSGEKARNAVMIPLVLMQYGRIKDKLASRDLRSYMTVPWLLP